MASDLRASDILNIDWNRRAYDRLDEARRKEAERLLREMYSLRVPELHRPLPSEPIEDREPSILNDPGSWLNKGLNRLAGDAARVILGEGTGNTKADLALGLLGPGAGIATEMAGGDSGLLDWLPGGGVLKAGVTSAPLALGVLRRVGTTVSADRSVQKIRDIAQDVITRLSRADHPVTAKEAAEAVSNAVELEGALRGSGTAKAQISDIVFKAMDIPTTNVITPKQMNVSGRTMDALTAAEVDTRRSATKEALSKNYKKYKEDFANLPEDVKQRILLGAEEARKKAIEAAVASGIPRRKIIDKIGPNAKANYIRSQTTAYINSLQPQKQTNTFAIPGSVSTSDEVRRIGRDKYYAALDDAKTHGMSEDEARKIAHLARNRAQRIAEHDVDSDNLAHRVAYNKASNHNMKFLFHIMEPDVQEEIMRTARDAGESAYNRYITSGASEAEAMTAKRNRFKTVKQSEVRKYIKELGFKSVNDPRLAQYSQLRRDGNHVLTTPTEQVLMAEAATPVKDYDVTPSKIIGTTPSRRLLPEDEFSDADITGLLREYGETPTADRIFNREYLEELLKEEGY